MPLKQAIIARFSAETLKEVCGHLNVEINGRSREAMVRQLGRQDAVSAESLLHFLSEAQLREVC